MSSIANGLILLFICAAILCIPGYVGVKLHDALPARRWATALSILVGFGVFAVTLWSFGPALDAIRKMECQDAPSYYDCMHPD